MYKYYNFLLLKILILILINSLFTITNIYSLEAINPQEISSDINQIDKNFITIKDNMYSESDSILNLAKESLYLSNKQGYDTGIGLSYMYLGLIYKQKNSNDSASYYLEKALDYSSENYETTADLYWELANLYRITGNYSASLEKSLILKELVEKNRIKKYTYQIYNLLGLSYQALMEFEPAFDNYQKSALLAEKNENKAFAGVVYSNIGKLFYLQNNFEHSLAYFTKGVKLEEEYKLYENAAYSYNTIANIYLKLKCLDSVEFYLKKSYNYFIEYDNKEEISDYYLTSGKYYYSRNELNTAKELLKKTIEIADKTGRKITLSEAYRLLSEISSKNNNHKEAYFYLKQYIDTYSLIYDIESINKAKVVEQKLLQQTKEGEVVTSELEKQKTKGFLLIIIIILAILLATVALIYVIHFKKLNRELKRSTERAKESDKLKSQFLRTISHEIRTPLNGITGFSEMILNEDLSKSELSKIYQFITKNSEDLISTIENMVDIAYLTSNQYQVNKDNIELSSILKSSIKQIKKETLYNSNKNVRIVLANSNCIKIYNDKTILMKIIKQLIKNALIYTKKGSITLGYNLEDSHIKLFVKDTGIGIPHENMDIIFSPFRQSKEALHNEYTGTGLGLSLVNEFVKILDGEIWLGSKPDQGSIFFISLPIK